MFIFPVTATQKKVGASLLCGSMTNVTPRMQWTPWTARSWMEGSCGSKWLGMEGRQTLTTAVAEEEGEEGRRGDKAATDAGAGALLAARNADDAAGPAAGAALAPEADPDTPDLDPGPTLDQSPALPRPRRPRTSPTPVPDLGPDPHLSPGPKAALLPPKESPGPNPKARPSQQQRMEANPLRSHHASHSFKATTSAVHHRIPLKPRCPAVKSFYFVLQALVCSGHFATKMLFLTHTFAVTFFFLYHVYYLLLREVSALMCFYNDSRGTHTTGIHFKDLSQLFCDVCFLMV